MGSTPCNASPQTPPGTARPSGTCSPHSSATTTSAQRSHHLNSARPLSETCTWPGTATPLPTDVEAALTTALSLTEAGEDLADFSQTRFPRVDFPAKAQLQRANLTGTDLVFAGLWRANLSEAKLQSSCLTFANLTEATLRNADLTGADLRGADLRNIFGMTPDQIRAVAVTDKDTKFGDVEGRDPNFCGPNASLGVELHPFPQ